MTKIEKMIKYCDDNKIFWFYDLADYAIKKRRDWFRTLATERGCKIIGLYLASKAYKADMLTDKQYAEWDDEFI